VAVPPPARRLSSSSAPALVSHSTGVLPPASAPGTALPAGTRPERNLATTSAPSVFTAPRPAAPSFEVYQRPLQQPQHSMTAAAGAPPGQQGRPLFIHQQMRASQSGFSRLGAGPSSISPRPSTPYGCMTPVPPTFPANPPQLRIRTGSADVLPTAAYNPLSMPAQPGGLNLNLQPHQAQQLVQQLGMSDTSLSAQQLQLHPALAALGAQPGLMTVPGGAGAAAGGQGAPEMGWDLGSLAAAAAAATPDTALLHLLDIASSSVTPAPSSLPSPGLQPHHHLLLEAMLTDTHVQQLLQQVQSTQAQLAQQEQQQALLAAALGMQPGGQPGGGDASGAGAGAGAWAGGQPWLAGVNAAAAANAPPQQQAPANWAGGQQGSRLPLLQQLHGATGQAAGYLPSQQARSSEQ
jgi:hypothetical protein